jgi:Subtilase family/Fibronectin type-III domain/Peptidase inhibitor I9/PA domain
MNHTRLTYPTWLSRLFAFAGLFSISFIVFLGMTLQVMAGQSENAEVAGKYKNNVYIVRMADQPVATYDGNKAGLRATKPARGGKIDRNSAEVRDYSAYLDSRHNAALAAVNGRKVHGYTHAFNGFAAELTAAQVEQMKNLPGVLSVDKDEARKLDTSTTPTFLGINARGGLWQRAGGAEEAGEKIIIGMVDSGIWPEHPSFANREGEFSNKNVSGWTGTCTAGEQFTEADCNGKIIGARFYNQGFGGDAGVKKTFPYEFNSPRDFEGHGTHTASTAGGNHDVKATGPASVFGKISGMAPGARIAVYKVCWGVAADPNAACFNSDSVAAIDQAVADGVDVINFSISGSRSSFLDPVEIAFMFAADAGVFVAASAGNSGPAASSVAHPGPWLTTVAAGTHNREIVGSATLGNGTGYSGSSTAAAAVGPKPLIDSTEAGVLPFASLTSLQQTALRRCFASDDLADATLLGSAAGANAALDPVKVAGKIVVCDRGTNARVNKSLAVQQAGGVGMILVNVTPNTLNADFHSVPTVHLKDTDRAAIKAYAATPGATATIAQASIVLTAPAPFTASFSSRGPLLAGGGDLLKPDLIAPGNDILAAVAPQGNSGRSFDIYSGTSMSSPHVAGLAAVLKSIHRDWTPMMIKSALMTTAYDVLDGPNTNPAVIFSQGAGHVKPNSAIDPGLVFDSGLVDWLGFLCGTQLAPSFCTSRGIPVLDPSNLNLPSIAFGDLAGAQTVTRTVTNVGERGTYSVSVTGLEGLGVAVSPATFTLRRGQSQKLSITVSRTTAALNTYGGGYLTWSDGKHNVRIPVVVRPVLLSVPRQVSGSFNANFGYSGAFTATPRGLIPAATVSSTIATDQAVDIPVTVSAGTTYARFSLFDPAVASTLDLDLEVYNSAGVLVGSSGGATAAEEVSLRNPVPDTYTVRVLGFVVPSGSENFTLYNWVLGSGDAGNMAVTAPPAAVYGQSSTIGITTKGLTSGVKYLGSVVYGGVAGLPNPTIVRVDAP